ncbi:MAG: lipopolysaccharide transport periplasmic protein LptA [Methylococcaceae bacterium]|nr:lipopolysaccharide transport periplasmic protein LptA [Methylococcaceae bacterium]
MKCNNTVLLFAFLPMATLPVQALETDSKQPMYIEADTATYDEAKGQTVYLGNVHFTQGSIESFSDKMIVYQKEGKTERVETFGNPTRVKQTPNPGKADWHGLGQRGEHFPDTGILILYEKAMAWQGDKPETSDRVNSERIEYDSRKSVMKAGDFTKGGGRVHVTLQPEDNESPSKAK